jgi:hypothetical protein
MEKEAQTPVDFAALQRRLTWQPIRHCPGRYVLRNAPSELSIERILGPEIEIKEYRVAAAKDLVLVAGFHNGGMISYKREDGTFLHTLNTTEGFARKLRQLGIQWPVTD